MNTPAPIPALFKHGSTWIRADFHMHTLADKEFSYSGDPNYFVSEYIAALKKAGIKIDRKILADLAEHEPEVFKKVVAATKEK